MLAIGSQIIMEHVFPERWNHVGGMKNPADCAPRSLFPSELLEHDLWWSDPK